MASSGTLEGTQQTLTDHLKELRNRFFAVAFVLIGGASLAYVFREPILTALLAPLHGQELITLTPGGGFKFILNISIFTGLAAATPIAIYNFYGFMKPIMPPKVQRFAPLFLLLSLILIIAGAAFAYYVAIPGALRFLMEFSGGYVTASLTADSYLSFVIAYMAGLALVFQVPLLLMIIHWIRPLTPSGLMKSQRWIILGAFIAAAIITPTPDPVNQTLIALPVIVVYQLGVAAVMISIYRARKQERRRSVQPVAALSMSLADTAPIPAVSAAPPTGARVRMNQGVMDIIAVKQPRPVANPAKRPIPTHATSLNASHILDHSTAKTLATPTRTVSVGSNQIHSRQQHTPRRVHTEQPPVLNQNPNDTPAENDEAFAFGIDLRDGLRPMTLE